ncbi:hypothetical protein EGJ48_11045 [Pantoea dispersa]|uniref:hypothetical protein n=1 Tax=Pantoea dispersa TaxID=59814 RepID=UPI000F667EEA|nr:hypothetical protein [Pantoea dispersa]RRW72513.1 hypothetical protein EGJ48_11045 [Pantoea dispersa]
MKHLSYLKSIFPKKREEWTRYLNGMLMSDSLIIGNPYDEDLNLLLLKYKKRNYINKEHGEEVLGLNDLVVKINSCLGDIKATVYPLKNDVYSGDCIVLKNEIIGCAFIKRGRSSYKKGLWMNGSKID